MGTTPAMSSMPRRAAVVLVAIATAAFAKPTTVFASVARSTAPTSLSARARSLGITKTGRAYRYELAEQTGDEGRLTVEVPAAWSDRASSQFRRPNTGAAYGVGLRATTNAEQFHNT